MQRKGWQAEGVGQVEAEPEEEVEKPKHWQHISFRYCVGNFTEMYSRCEVQPDDSFYYFFSFIFLFF